LTAAAIRNAGPSVDPIALTQALVRCASVTPADDGALEVLRTTLEPLGFLCQRLRFCDPASPPVDNLFARLGSERPHFCFAGHSDVVPVGQGAAWTVDPFAGKLIDGQLWGRGASDMKGAIAAFVAAVARFLAEHPAGLRGSISLLITGDEEGPAVNGTVKVLDWMAANGHAIDHCIVGEPSNPGRLGQMIKHGRRGSLNARLTVLGQQGHVAYPELADNPLPRLLRTLLALSQHKLDAGTADFQPSNLELTTVDVGNRASNVIPHEASAGFNIRFNVLHTGDGLGRWLRQLCEQNAGRHRLEISISGEAFLTTTDGFIEHLQGAIAAQTGRPAELSTAGGTSDARFIRRFAPVVEFGLVGQTMHKVDERAALADIEGLTRIYHGFLARYFA